MDGMVQRMQKHVVNCEKIGHEQKARIYSTIASIKHVPETRSVAKNNESVSSTTACVDTHQAGIKSYNNPIKLSSQMEEDYSLSLFRAFNVGHVSLNLADSFYFEEFIKKVKPSWIIPSQTTSIYLALIRLHDQYNRVKKNCFVDHYMICLSKRMEQHFSHAIFPVSIFLWPLYRDLRITKKFSANWMTKEMIQLSILWKFTKSKCITINHSLQQYIATNPEDFMLGLDPIFWKTTSKFDSALRRLATIVFKITGHAAPVETIFSVLY
jgi:hypothetical protein